MTKIGDRVNWDLDLERVDYEDFLAHADLSFEALSTVLGALLGKSVFGLLTKLTYDGSTPAAVTINPFVAASSSASGESVVVRYDRNLAWQEALSTASLDFSGKGLCVVWARSWRTPVTPEPRRFFDDVAGIEDTEPVHPTRLREVVQLAITDDPTPGDPPDDQEGWIPIANAQESGGAVVLRPITIWDYYAGAAVSVAGDSSHVWAQGIALGTDDAPSSAGLASILRTLWGLLHLAMDSDWDFDKNWNNVGAIAHTWLDPKLPGRKQLVDMVENATMSDAAIRAAVGPRTLAIIGVDIDGGEYVINASKSWIPSDISIVLTSESLGGALRRADIEYYSSSNVYGVSAEVDQTGASIANVLAGTSNPRHVHIATDNAWFASAGPAPSIGSFSAVVIELGALTTAVNERFTLRLFGTS